MSGVIVGISGKAGSGKSLTAQILERRFGFATVALVDPIKRAAREFYGFSVEQLWGPSDRRNAPDKRYVRAKKPRHDWNEDAGTNGFRCGACGLSGEEATPECCVYLTPRHALQKLGVEVGRECYENTWIDLGIRTAKTLMTPSATGESYVYSPERGLTIGTSSTSSPSGVSIPDCRFLGEIKALKECGAYLLRIIRPGSGLSGVAAEHASEKEQDSIKDSEFDAVVQNAGSVEDLEIKLNNLVGSWLEGSGTSLLYQPSP